MKDHNFPRRKTLHLNGKARRPEVTPPTKIVLPPQPKPWSHDQWLQEMRESETELEFVLGADVVLNGYVLEVDRYTILISTNNGAVKRLLFKHALEEITVAEVA
ncbi:RNA chaperone Hfq [Dyella telluris]|uniref:RNA chaperone Hfq n=1 Tax=Dyella telluris TaxID=2763498 RepID=A0A7G8Q4D9_9GAMM|nr:RNA chaperone Hfq [Dyella telluris]QNK01647.1 RNA chaperone Hfq [Dyella telluris]